MFGVYQDSLGWGRAGVQRAARQSLRVREISTAEVATQAGFCDRYSFSVALETDSFGFC